MSDYGEALERGRKVGVSRCDDAAYMAPFCHTSLAPLVGAVSPRLVWEGAQARGLDTKALTRLCASNPNAVADLMWVTS